VLVSWSGDGLVVETNGTHLPLLAY
jgi:hypothetical protein